MIGGDFVFHGSPKAFSFPCAYEGDLWKFCFHVVKENERNSLVERE